MILVVVTDRVREKRSRGLLSQIVWGKRRRGRGDCERKEKKRVVVADCGREKRRGGSREGFISVAQPEETRRCRHNGL